MIVGFLGGSILFTYKVGMEAKDAIITLKIHVDHSNYAETIGLNKWVEENNVTQQIDSYMSQAYEALLEQVMVLMILFPSIGPSLLWFLLFMSFFS